MPQVVIIITSFVHYQNIYQFSKQSTNWSRGKSNNNLSSSQVACETFCLDDDDTLLEATITLQSETLTAQTVRFVEEKPFETAAALSKCHNKKVCCVHPEYKILKI